ncbi:MAG: Ig-like domain-containing protein, partial [Clostridia bacterium]|nr:Ig-like domain-containing protein [Clostridia bacterium]
NTSKFSSVWNVSNEDVSNYLPSNMVSGYNKCADMTDYFKSEIDSNSQYATFMMLFTYADAQKFENPMIMVETADVADKPVITLAKDKESVLVGESVRITASSESKLADVKFYVDDELYNGAVTSANGAFSADISDLEYGEHKISAVGIDIFGSLSDKAEINVSATRLKITSSASIAPSKPYVLKAMVRGLGSASVEFKVDDIVVGTTQTPNENGEYVLQVTSGLEEGKHVVTATATDNATSSVGTASQTIYVNGRYNLIPLADGSGVGYITDKYEYASSSIFDIAEGNSATLAVSKVDGSYVKSTYSYYQYDVSGIDKSRIENAYIVYATKSSDAQDYVRMDIERIGTYTDKNDAISKNVIETVRSFVSTKEGNITETDDDYSIINNIKKTNDAQVISKLDVTDYIKNLDTNGENLALRFSKYTNGTQYGGAFGLQTTPYIYVTYKQDFIVDNGTSVSVNLRPADYTSTYDKIAVMIAKYNSEGVLINAKVEKDIPVTGAYTCIDADKDNASVIKIFIWNNMENMYPLAKVTEYR